MKKYKWFKNDDNGYKSYVCYFGDVKVYSIEQHPATGLWEVYGHGKRLKTFNKASEGKEYVDSLIK